MLKFAYTLIVDSVECISSMDSAEEVLDFLKHHLSSKIYIQTTHALTRVCICKLIR